MARCFFFKYFTYISLFLAAESFLVFEPTSLIHRNRSSYSSRRACNNIRNKKNNCSVSIKKNVGSAPYTTTTCCFLLDVVTHASSRNYPSSSSSSLLQSTFYNSNKNKNRYDPTLLKISAGRRIGGGIFSNRNFELALASKKQQQQQQQEQEEDSTRTNISSPAKNDQSSTSNIQQTDQQLGIRLNKVFKETHSRRQADDLIASGRVTVNGKPVIHKGGFMVVPYRDIIAVDGVVVKGWESMNGINVPMPSSLANSIGGSHKITSIHQSSQESSSGTSLNTKQFEYVKYFKPLGVICTTDVRIRGNIIDSIRRDGYVPRHRVFPVGRLDKETTGLIILTSDGRLVNSVLRGEMKQPKVYKVMVDGRLGDKHLERLRNGVVITTVSQRKGKTIPENTLVAKTKPCVVERLGPCSCKMTLVEGRNRQIRKMMQALGFTVVKLHRVEFMGICLGEQDSSSDASKGLKRPGDWAYLDASEMNLVKKALLRSSLSQESMQDASLDEEEEQ